MKVTFAKGGVYLEEKVGRFWSSFIGLRVWYEWLCFCPKAV
jgi:hypothetical protein